MESGPAPFLCQLCDKYFDDEKELKRHEAKSRQHFALVQKHKAERRRNLSANNNPTAAAAADLKPAASPVLQQPASASSSTTTPTRSDSDAQQRQNNNDNDAFPKNRVRKTSSSDSDTTPNLSKTNTSSDEHKFPICDEDIDDDGVASTVGYSDLIGGPGNYLRPAAVAAATAHSFSNLSADLKPVVNYSQSSSSLNDAETRELNYFPVIPTVEPMMSETDVKPALVSYASTRPTTSVAATFSYSSDLKPNESAAGSSVASVSAHAVASVSAQAAESPSTTAYAAASSNMKPNLTDAVSSDVKPTCAATNSGGVADDDDDDVVFTEFTPGRLRGGHDIGTEFRRFADARVEEVGESSVSNGVSRDSGVNNAFQAGSSSDGVVTNANDTRPADAAETSDDDLIIEEEVSGGNGGEQIDKCPYCNIRLSNETHWKRHKETLSHKTNEQNHVGNTGDPFQAEARFQYGFEEEEEEYIGGDLVDPVIEYRQRVNPNTYACAMCDKYCTSVESFQAHMKGAKHERKEKEKELLAKRKAMIEQQLIDAPPEDLTQELEDRLLKDTNPHVGLYLIQEFNFAKDVRFNCHLCGIATLTRANLSTHVKSNKHRRAYLEEYWPSLLDDDNKSEDKLLYDAAKKAKQSLPKKHQYLNRAEGVISEELKDLIAKKKDSVRNGVWPWSREGGETKHSVANASGSVEEDLAALQYLNRMENEGWDRGCDGGSRDGRGREWGGRDARGGDKDRRRRHSDDFKSERSRERSRSKGKRRSGNNNNRSGNDNNRSGNDSEDDGRENHRGGKGGSRKGSPTSRKRNLSRDSSQGSSRDLSRSPGRSRKKNRSRDPSRSRSRSRSHGRKRSRSRDSSPDRSRREIASKSHRPKGNGRVTVSVSGRKVEIKTK